MRYLSMRFFGAIMGALMMSSAFAQDVEISCDDVTAQAVMNIPKPANNFLRVICTRFGNVLTPAAGWLWTSPGAYKPKFFPAQMVQRNPKETGNTVFFTSIKVNTLDREASQDKWSFLAGMFPPEESPKTALEVIAKSNVDGHHFIYIFPNSWGYSCSPTCRLENAFIMISQDSSVPRW